MDDDDHLREAAGGALGHLGYDMLFARHGQEAIDIYSREMEAGTPIEAAILDWTVAGRNGGGRRRTQPSGSGSGSPAHSFDGVFSLPGIGQFSLLWV